MIPACEILCILKEWKVIFCSMKSLSALQKKCMVYIQLHSVQIYNSLSLLINFKTLTSIVWWARMPVPDWIVCFCAITTVLNGCWPGALDPSESCLREKRGDARKAQPQCHMICGVSVEAGTGGAVPLHALPLPLQAYRNFICLWNSSSVWKNDRIAPSLPGAQAWKCICGSFKGLLMSQEQHRNRQCQNPS